MAEEARKIMEAIKEAFEVLSAMELPAEEQKIEITRDAAMTLIAELEQVTRERDAAVEDINRLERCEICTCDICKFHMNGCYLRADLPRDECFEWRGVR